MKSRLNTLLGQPVPCPGTQSVYAVSAAADRVIPTLKALRQSEPEMEWQARCD